MKQSANTSAFKFNRAVWTTFIMVNILNILLCALLDFQASLGREDYFEFHSNFGFIQVIMIELYVAQPALITKIIRQGTFVSDEGPLLQMLNHAAHQSLYFDLCSC